jgi:methylated-DNA-[protein]-cysteine S-methyltransferase
VIGASGDLTGFAGGLANKMFLLSLEAGQTSLEAAADSNDAAAATAAAASSATPGTVVREAPVKPARPAPSRGTQHSLFGN